RSVTMDIPLLGSDRTAGQQPAAFCRTAISKVSAADHRCSLVTAAVRTRVPSRGSLENRATRQHHVSHSEHSPTTSPARRCPSGAIVLVRTGPDRSDRVGTLKG